jgi:Lrp/AsnC family transcriptional regulator for asnA, asnC and gidA
VPDIKIRGESLMIDELDRKIVWALNANARKSFREIAKEVGTSTTAVINAVKKLETAGAIKGYIPVVDPEYFGVNLIAVIALRISKGKLLETQRKISQDPRVTAVYDVTGDWDSFVIGYFKDREDLNRFIKKLLGFAYPAYLTVFVIEASWLTYALASVDAPIPGRWLLLGRAAVQGMVVYVFTIAFWVRRFKRKART